MFRSGLIIPLKLIQTYAIRDNSKWATPQLCRRWIARHVEVNIPRNPNTSNLDLNDERSTHTGGWSELWRISRRGKISVSQTDPKVKISEKSQGCLHHKSVSKNEDILWTSFSYILKHKLKKIITRFYFQRLTTNTTTNTTQKRQKTCSWYQAACGVLILLHDLTRLITQ